jgi:hypothetical protein
MKNQLMRLTDKLMSRKRSIIETIIDQCKNISQIEHSRHRSPINFLVNVVCGLIAYCHQPSKPSLNIHWVTISRLRELVGTGQQGTTLLGLKQVRNIPEMAQHYPKYLSVFKRGSRN